MGMHHGDDPMQQDITEDMRSALAGEGKQDEIKNIRQAFAKLDQIHGLGPTGKFPQGRLQKGDEGEIRFNIGLSKDGQKTMINFGKAVRWVGMDRNQAIEVGNAIIKTAKMIKSKTEGGKENE